MITGITKNERIMGTYPLFAVLPDTEEYWDNESFTNLTDPDIKCLWAHDHTLELGSIGRGSLRLWLGGRALHLELSPEEGNEIAEYVFATRMREEPYIGMSPGFDILPSQKKAPLGSKHRRVRLYEFSLLTHPAHRGSEARLEFDIDTNALNNYLANTRKWLAGVADAHGKGQSELIAGHRAYLEESKRLTRAIGETSDTEALSPDEVAHIRATSPYFRARPGFPEGYERSAFSTLQ